MGEHIDTLEQLAPFMGSEAKIKLYRGAAQEARELEASADAVGTENAGLRARIRELEATIARVRDEIDTVRADMAHASDAAEREGCAESAEAYRIIVTRLTAALTPTTEGPKSDCESTFVMGSVSRFDTNTADGRESGE